MKIKIILLYVLAFFSYQISQACDAYTSFCSSSTYVSNEMIVVGTITNSFANSVELTIIDVLYGGVVNNSSVTIWDGTTFECNGPWPNDANDMGNIHDTILCIIEPIISIQNPWDVIGEYRRPSVFASHTSNNFSIGSLFEGTYSYNDVLSLDFADYCCENLDQYNFYFTGLPESTGSSAPIALSGFPGGGTFSGPGIIFNAFNPSIAGSGIHTITYTVDDEFGCSFSTQESILVFTITYNFVNYNLGTINPKINNQLDLEVNIPEPDQYTFEIFDLAGKQCYHYAAQLRASTHSQNIQLNQNLGNGIYLLSISNKHTIVTQKFMVSG